MGGRILASPIEMVSHPYNSAALPRSLWYKEENILQVKKPLLWIPLTTANNWLVGNSVRIYLYKTNDTLHTINSI